MSDRSLGERIVELHDQIRRSCDRLGRISVALYNADTGGLYTFVDSTDQDSPLTRYEVRLQDVPSLMALAKSGESRVIDDLAAISASGSYHTRQIIHAGFRSSFTIPMYIHDHLLGFLFFDATEKSYFTAALRIHLGIYAQLIAAIIAGDIHQIRTLKGAVKTAREFSKFRDEETGAHLSRMSHYARLIAFDLAAAHGLSDEYIEYILQFAPMHDIGKVAVPDSILLKPGKLVDEEVRIMSGHVEKGAEIIDIMINEFDLDNLHHIDVLRNIVATHHENFDGSGYPGHLAGDGIPLEGRIIRAADVFDALTSVRPYKQAWPFDVAMQYMEDNAGGQFDPACVAAIRDNYDRMQQLHDRFKDDLF